MSLQAPKEIGTLRLVEMSKRASRATSGAESTNDQIYLPAVSLPPRFGRVERFLADRFGSHGLIPIPRSYNK